MYGMPIQISIEDKRIIISNACILPDGWTIDKLSKAHYSAPYNPDMANVFYRAGYIEHWGRGIQKINDACKELGAEPPQFELIGYGLRVYFKALESALFDDDLKNHNDPINDGLKNKILQQLAIEPSITRVELAENLGISDATVKRKIKELKAAGIVERIGSKKTGRWVVKNNTKHNS